MDQPKTRKQSIFTVVEHAILAWLKTVIGFSIAVCAVALAIWPLVLINQMDFRPWLQITLSCFWVTIWWTALDYYEKKK